MNKALGSAFTLALALAVLWSFNRLNETTKEVAKIVAVGAEAERPPANVADNPPLAPQSVAPVAPVVSVPEPEPAAVVAPEPSAAPYVEPARYNAAPVKKSNRGRQYTNADLPLNTLLRSTPPDIGGPSLEISMNPAFGNSQIDLQAAVRDPGLFCGNVYGKPNTIGCLQPTVRSRK